MKRDAKASTAGSIQRLGAGLGRILRGTVAGRLVLPAGVFAAILALVILAGSASAANGVSRFFGGEGATGGLFASSSSGPGGVAVNQAGTGGANAGDVYVVDRGNRRVQQFTAAGAFVRAFGKDVGGAGVDVCEVAASCVQASASAEAAGMNNPQGIAIDQVTGNVFVSDQSNRRIDVFSAEGEFQGAFGWGVDTGAAALQFCTTASTCQAPAASGAAAGQLGTAIGYPAIAPAGSPNAGNLYLADKSNRRVDEFKPLLTGEEVTGVEFVKAWGWGVDTGAAEFQQCTTASTCQNPNTSSPTGNPGQFASNQPSALAVDSNGNVYAAESTGNNRAQKFDSTGNPAVFNGADLAGSPGPIDLAVDPGTNRLFGLKEVSGTSEKRVLELTAGGALVSTHASGTTISSANGLAVVNGTTNFYVSTSLNSTYRGVFFLATKVNPTATVEAPSPLEAHSATLRGKVNPTGFTTAYHFELSADSGVTWERLPASDIDLGSGEADIPVSWEVDGLIGGHAYRYRIVATKPFGAGSKTSSQQSFTAPASAPQVAAFSSTVTTSTAVLNAEINPENQETNYHFEWGSADCSANPCTSVPATDAGIGSGESVVTVAKEISGLEPDTTYHFRVVATNATGTTEGPDVTLRTYAPFAPDTSCPNQTYRYGAGADLPDCRAYEMVSPLDKEGGDVAIESNTRGTTELPNRSSLDGDRFTFISRASFADPEGAPYFSQYMARRGPSGWSTENLSAARNFADFEGAPSLESTYKAFSPDLTIGWLWNDTDPPLAPGAPTNRLNLYKRYDDGSFETVTNGEPGNKVWIPAVEGITGDGSHTVFSAKGPLTPDAPSGSSRQLYEWAGGELRLVSVLPNGTAYTGESVAGFGKSSGVGATGRHSWVNRAVSADGSHIFWTALGSKDIYVRIDGETTIPVSGAGGHFWTASVDGSTAVYTVGENLYEFDVETETPSLIAEGTKGVAGASEDLSYLYFVSTENLAEGASGAGTKLYLRQGEAIRYISSSPGSGGYSPIQPDPEGNSGRVTPDGHQLVFSSQLSLTGYDNTDTASGEGAYEVYRYDADADQLGCVSCNPSGARPEVRMIKYFGEFREVPAAAMVPGWQTQTYQPRYLSDDGDRVFFNSYDALLPQDTNGEQDAYQWEADGTGSCTREEGCLSLLSTGKGSRDAEFIDADPSGDNAFIGTYRSLTAGDPGGADAYVARVGGGYPPPPASPTPCVGDACQSIPAAPFDKTPASAAFRGAGNLIQGADCTTQARRARRLRTQAKQLHRRARRAATAKQKRVLNRRAKRSAAKANRLGKQARRCRRGGGGAGR